MLTLNRGVFFLGLCACMGGLTGCDPGDDASIAGRRSDEPIDLLDLANDPMFGPSSTMPADTHAVTPRIAAAPADPVHSKANRYKPRESDVIGWTRWALAQPYSTHPVSDPTGELCGLGQDGPIFYLAGTFGGPVERACDIPPGKQLVFPLINSWYMFPDEYYADDEALILENAAWIADWFVGYYADVCDLTLTLDGVALADYQTLYDEFYAQAVDPFMIDLNEDHKASASYAGGEMLAMGVGYYANVQPLTPGDHVLELGGDNCGPYPFSTYARYELHVGN